MHINIQQLKLLKSRQYNFKAQEAFNKNIQIVYFYGS